MEAKNLRNDFPLLASGLVYLDNAATTQRPRHVIETLIAFYERSNATIHRSPHALGQAATAMYEQAHAGVASFIGASSFREIVFLRNTTEALNLVAVSLCRGASGPLAFQPGDEVVITIMEHHSNFVPWQELCRGAGLHLRIIGLRDHGALDLDQLSATLGPRTRLVCCTHVSNVLGTINPLGDIARMTHDAGALLLVDAAQSVPCMPVDVRSLGCDFLAFSGHKMLAPFGTGVLYAREDLLEHMSPFLFGGDMIHSVTESSSKWNSLPWKFEAGTPDVAAGIALGGATEPRTGQRLVGAVDYLSAIGMDNVRAHEKLLLEKLVKGLQEIPRVTVTGPRDCAQRAAAVSFSVDGADPFVVARLLDDEGICVRAGGHCAYPLAARLGVEGTVRASPYIYNTTEEIDQFLEVVKDIVAHRIV
ncbi:MAG TPA: cysteine desulfurase [Spirochaetia bacterium]|nr:cysteine desulfurase [Spirochaetia bacterium]